MGIKKNFIYNTILLASQYVVPLIVFPYISRVFGADRIGIINFADSLVNYFILFCTMGLTLTGIREIAKNKNDRLQLNKAFSELFYLHAIVTFIVLVIYFGIIFYFEKLNNHIDLYLIGASKLLFNVFLLEWFFRGIENFKFITLRSIFIKIVYVILLFVLVKNKEDYFIYFLLTCGIVIVNGIINIWYSFKSVSLVFERLNIKRHLEPFFTIGIYMILTGMTTTYNVIYLGIIASNESVGYYTTSLKLYTIILGFFSAMNMVLIPRLSALIAEGNDVDFNRIIDKSISFLCIFSFPIIMFCIALAPQIVFLAAGSGFEGAITCFRTIIPLIFIVGIAQIFCNQILMSLKRDRDLTFTAFIGAAIGISLNLILVPNFKEIGTSIVDLISEFSITVILYIFCVKHVKIKLPFRMIFWNLIVSLPFLLICYITTLWFSNDILTVFCASFLCLCYFLLSQFFILKNKLIIDQLTNVKYLFKKS